MCKCKHYFSNDQILYAFQGILTYLNNIVTLINNFVIFFNYLCRVFLITTFSTHYLMQKRNILTLLAAILIVADCFAWGQVGHDTTCSIAENHLSRKAKKKIKKAFDGKSIIYWSNWLDNASHQPAYSYTSTWHYKNINADQEYKDVPPFETGDIVTALTDQIAKLKDRKSLKLSKEEEALALKIVVHLVGDLHQPMHMGRQTDLGGNRVKVDFFRNPDNLHHVWDEGVVERGHHWTYDEWTHQIDRASKAEIAEILKGDIDTWAQETYAITKKVYAATPEGTKISYDYVATWTPIVEQQFLRGGLRLAYILNDIYK